MLKFSRLLIAIAMLSLGLTPAACAADSDTAYILTYFDTNFAAKDKVRPLVKKLGDASMKEAGNLRFEVLQRIGQPDQFVILEAWKDKAALTAHAEAAHTKDFREKLSGLLRSAYDERPHSALGIGAINTPAAQSKGGIFAVTHVDIVPTEKERDINLVKDMTANSRSDAGAIRFEVLTQISRPNHVTVVKIWKNKAASDAGEAAPHKVKFRETLAPMSGSLYDERFYRSIN